MAHEAAVRQEFEEEGHTLNFVGGSQYLEAYLCPREELEAWVRSQVESWAHGVYKLGKKSKQYSQ